MTSSSKSETRRLTLPSEQWKKIDELTDRAGHIEWPQFVRPLLSEALLAYEARVLATENKRLVKQKLEIRLGNMKAAVKTFAAWFNGAEISLDEVADAIDAINQALDD